MCVYVAEVKVDFLRTFLWNKVDVMNQILNFQYVVTKEAQPWFAPTEKFFESRTLFIWLKSLLFPQISHSNVYGSLISCYFPMSESSSKRMVKSYQIKIILLKLFPVCLFKIGNPFAPQSKLGWVRACLKFLKTQIAKMRAIAPISRDSSKDLTYTLNFQNPVVT